MRSTPLPALPLTARVALSASLLLSSCIQAEPSSFNAGAGDGASMGGANATGGTSATGGAVGTVACGDEPAPGRSPLRRLNRDEYRSTVRDLLPEASAVVDATVDVFPLDEQKLGFSNNADALNMSPQLAFDYVTAAETFAGEAVQHLESLLRCDPAVNGEDECARSFIDDFGGRAFRRPLSNDESARYFTTYANGSVDGFEHGISLVIQAFLQSPNFLYRVERGVPTETAGTAALTPFELASRLSYFIWGSMPDAALLTDAAASRLSSAADVEVAARRMLQDPRAKGAVARFHRQWLGLDGVLGAGKDATLFPEFTPAIANLLYEEATRFVDDVFWNDGRSDALLTAPFTFVNDELAAFYGLPAVGSPSFVKVSLNPAQRVGILTQGALMASLAYANQTSPIYRGKFVREHWLCQELQPAPPELQARVKPPPFDPALPTRERFAAHSSDPVCAGCHTLMDPIGLGFETFDAIGRYRTTDAGMPVDASGTLVAAGDADGAFNGPVELAAQLAASRTVQDCIVTEWFRFATGRAEDVELDACTLQSLKDAFEASGHDLHELIVKIAASDAFRFRSTAGGGP